MKVIPAELVELDDATCWVRVGDRMVRVDRDGGAWLATPASEPAAPPVEVHFGGEVKPLAPVAQPKAVSRAVVKGQRIGTSRVPPEQRAQYEKARAGGMSVKAASAHAKVKPATAYTWEAQKKKAAEPLEAAPKRRCHECQAITQTDPCGNCGTAWQRKARAA